MIKNEIVTIIKEGKPVGEHECKWVRSEVNANAPNGVTDFKRICCTCGRLEHIVQSRSVERFDEVYKRFYGEEC